MKKLQICVIVVFFLALLVPVSQFNFEKLEFPQFCPPTIHHLSTSLKKTSKNKES